MINLLYIVLLYIETAGAIYYVYKINNSKESNFNIKFPSVLSFVFEYAY